MAQITSESEDTSSENKDEKKILEEAHTRFKLVEDAESDNRIQSLDDLRFVAGEQWPPEVMQERQRDGRPCLVINKLPQSIQQITNDQRQNRPAIKVHPVDEGADIETAKVFQGMIRHIEYDSSAEAAYDTAFDAAVNGGWGYWRVVTEFENPLSFNQKILIKRIRNKFSVFFDPYSQEPDGSDASYAFVVEDLSEDEYKAKYPDSKLASRGEWESVGNNAPMWMPSGSARVAEYFYKENKEETLVLLSDGRTLLKKQLPKDFPKEAIVNERKTMVPTIKWVKLNGCEILEQTDWLGVYIPIVPVYGTERDIDGERILEGVVRNAKDPARMYNYWASAETEAIALAPRTPFIAAEGQLEGYETDWANANRKNQSVLVYKPTTIGGSPVPPPQRNAFEPAVQAITQARMLASDDIKATTGIYDATLGGRSNETSGVAIQRRNNQAQTSNFHFVDNLTRSLKHTGRILIDLIPKVYDTARTIRIIAEDGEQRVVKVNDPSFEENGKATLYELDAGKYDVTVDVGPSFQTKRQEAAASMLDLTKAMPQLMNVAGDLLVKNMDWPGAQDIAERLKKTLPPGIADDKDKSKEIPPQVQAQMQQMNQLVEQLTGKVNELQTEKDQKLVELESKERIEMAKLENQATIELAKLESKESLQLLGHQIAELDQRMQMLGFNQPFPQDQNFEAQPQDGGMPAESMAEPQPQPTGGYSPGLPMEGNEP